MTKKHSPKKPAPAASGTKQKASTSKQVSEEAALVSDKAPKKGAKVAAPAQKPTASGPADKATKASKVADSKGKKGKRPSATSPNDLGARAEAQPEPTSEARPQADKAAAGKMKPKRDAKGGTAADAVANVKRSGKQKPESGGAKPAKPARQSAVGAKVLDEDKRPLAAEGRATQGLGSDTEPSFADSPFADSGVELEDAMPSEAAVGGVGVTTTVSNKSQKKTRARSPAESSDASEASPPPAQRGAAEPAPKARKGKSKRDAASDEQLHLDVAGGGAKSEQGEPEAATGTSADEQLPTTPGGEQTVDAEARPDEDEWAEESDEAEALAGVLSADEPQSPVAEDEDAGLTDEEINRRFLKGLIEALLFASEKPLSLRELARSAKLDKKRTTELLREVTHDFRKRGMNVVELAGGFGFRSNPAYAPYVQKLLSLRPVRLSRAQLETLAVIAYRQPVTRPEIDDVRGVDSGPVIKGLLDRDLIKMLGKKDEVGRPMLYGTTDAFLELFSLESLKDLPSLREFTELSDDSREKYKETMGETAPGYADGATLEDTGEAAADGDVAELAEPSSDAEASSGGEQAGAAQVAEAAIHAEPGARDSDEETSSGEAEGVSEFASSAASEDDAEPVEPLDEASGEAESGGDAALDASAALDEFAAESGDIDEDGSDGGSVNGDLDAAEPDAAEPDAAEPDAAEPEASEPEASEPEASEPEVESEPERPPVTADLET